MKKDLRKPVKTTAMALFLELLFLAVMLLPFFPANGQDPSFTDLSTTQIRVQQEIINKHNDLRRSVSPPASNMLKTEWNKKAAENAQNWANKCTLEHSHPEDRKTSTRCGENLYMSSQPDSWSDAIQAWYDEYNDFIHGKGPKTPGAVVGHYTQVVWYSSYRIGCGVAYCPGQVYLKYYYVCQYCPAGNYRDKINTPYLEGKPCASCPNHCDNGLCTNVCEYENKYNNCNDLKKRLSCNYSLLKDNCKASCHCENKIY
ncbi:cysteine-rich secretory protein 3-like [Hyaena hyaena]|uniref:cysteine-rich secretory protein 3-like n=1 Tax=Hyaena hyaena TaxID=95912 RepID=UPI0019218ABE|nr:cysteine-rich secretory protein 3-like [Hyaena hyaena]